VLVLSAALLVLLPGSALAQPQRRTTRADVEAELRARDSERQREAHCAEVGRAACEREQREAARAWDREVAVAEARHCAEVGPTRCREEREALESEARRDFLIPVGLAVGLSLLLATRLRAKRPPPKPLASPAADRRDLATLDIALGHEAARALRQSITQASAQSSLVGLPAIVQLVRDARPRWTHVAVRSWPMAGADATEARLRSVRSELQARPSKEIAPPAREAGDGYRGAPPPLADGATEPLALLSLTVLSRVEIPEPDGAPDARAMALLVSLRSLGPDATEVVDVTWLPAHEGDALTEHELVTLQPRLVALAKPAS
jgi:hypothetical protein